MKKINIDPNAITIVLTSCGRFDLLGKTIDTFSNHFNYKEIVIVEDSVNLEGIQSFVSRRSGVRIRFNDPKLGQMASIDAAYAAVETPYIFHLEDDWHFFAGYDLEKCTSALEKFDDCSGIILAFNRFEDRFGKHIEKLDLAGGDYFAVNPSAHPEWFSYTFNPSIVRRETWRQYGPFSQFISEAKLSHFMKQTGKRCYFLNNHIGEHIGDGRHVDDPFQPKRPKTFFERLKRSIQKRLPS